MQSDKVSLFLSPYSEREKGQKSTLKVNILIEKTWFRVRKCPFLFPIPRKRKGTKKLSVYQHPYREDMIQSDKVSLFCSLYLEREKGQKSSLYINILIEKTWYRVRKCPFFLPIDIIIWYTTIPMYMKYTISQELCGPAAVEGMDWLNSISSFWIRCCFFVRPFSLLN